MGIFVEFASNNIFLVIPFPKIYAKMQKRCKILWFYWNLLTGLVAHVYWWSFWLSVFINLFSFFSWILCSNKCVKLLKIDEWNKCNTKITIKNDSYLKRFELNSMNMLENWITNLLTLRNSHNLLIQLWNI